MSMGGGANKVEEVATGDPSQVTRGVVDGFRQMLGLADQLSAINLNNLLPSVSDLKSGGFGYIVRLTVEMTRLATTVEKTMAGIRVATGMNDLYTDSMRSLVAAQDNIGLSMEDYTEVVTGLHKGMTLLPTASSRTRDSLIKTTSELKRLGVSADTSGAALDILTRSMGMVPAAANEAIRSFDLLAQEVGLSTSEILESFVQLSPQLSKYGRRTDAVFMSMAKTARSFGVTAQQAFDFADQFDTWSGAAEVVGKLNAQFAEYGLQLNDIALMEMEEADRIKEINRQFKSAGLAVSEFGRREMQMLADAATKGDVNLAEKYFGSPEDIEAYMKSQDDLTARAEKFTTSMDKIGASMQAIFIDSGILDATVKALQGIATAINDAEGPAGRMAALIGGIISLPGQVGLGAFMPKNPVTGNDVILRPNEPPIMLNEDDTIIAGTGLATKGGKGGYPSTTASAAPSGLNEAAMKRAFMAALSEFGAARGDVSKMKFEADGRQIGRIASNHINKTYGLGQPA
jgi:uncharacterized protein with GYD domain